MTPKLAKPNHMKTVQTFPLRNQYRHWRVAAIITSFACVAFLFGVVPPHSCPSSTSRPHRQAGHGLAKKIINFDLQPGGMVHPSPGAHPIEIPLICICKKKTLSSTPLGRRLIHHSPAVPDAAVPPSTSPQADARRHSSGFCRTLLRTVVRSSLGGGAPADHFPLASDSLGQGAPRPGWRCHASATPCAWHPPHRTAVGFWRGTCQGPQSRPTCQWKECP